jgi:phenylacetate-coenzyme A ligase PaaK-like adenylate-forming protein
MVASAKQEWITDIKEIASSQNRPPNLVDYLLLETDIYENRIPKGLNDYISLICHRDLTKAIAPIIGGITNRYARKIEDDLVGETVLFAVRNSPAYRKKYKAHLGINDSERLANWVKKEITSSEDLTKLPTITNTDLKYPKEGAAYWYIPGKAFKRRYQTGGTTTGKSPSKIPYSHVDDEVATLISCAGLIKYAEVKEGQKALSLAPGYPHAFGPKLQDSLERLGVCCDSRHFAPQTPEDLLALIDRERPSYDILIGAPHGPKGATGSLDVLKATDDTKGTDIFQNNLRDSTIIVGGAPITRDLLNELYKEVGAGLVVNGYGSAQMMGYFDRLDLDGDSGGYRSSIDIPLGYWIVHPTEDESVPARFSKGLFTVLGREIMPIINYDPNDILKINNSKITDLCRAEWFKQEEDGSWKVVIPVNAGTCASAV